MQWSYLGGLGHSAATVVRLDRPGCLVGWLGDPRTRWRRPADAAVCPRVLKCLTGRRVVQTAEIAPLHEGYAFWSFSL